MRRIVSRKAVSLASPGGLTEDADSGASGGRADAHHLRTKAADQGLRPGSWRSPYSNLSRRFRAVQSRPERAERSGYTRLGALSLAAMDRVLTLSRLLGGTQGRSAASGSQAGAGLRAGTCHSIFCRTTAERNLP